VSERTFHDRRREAGGDYLPVDPQTLGRLRILRVGDAELHLDGHKLLVRGTPVHVTHKEFLILRQLMDNAGRVVSKRELLDGAWGPDRRDDRTYLEVHIRRLRAKIDTDEVRSTRIRTVRGIGYIFDLPQGEPEKSDTSAQTATSKGDRCVQANPPLFYSS
jgi:DNA-binding response OmpR family regulator